MKHLLITGQPGRGKTTLVNRLIETFGLQPAGFQILLRTEPSGRRTFVMHSIREIPGLANDQRIASVSSPADRQVFPEGFNGLGLACLQQALALSADCIVLDELGRFEQTAPAFLQAVEAVFNQQDCPVIAVLKAEPIPYILNLRQRPDCVLIDLDQIDHETAFQSARQHLLEQGRFLHLIFMAAGNSTRYGSNKLLALVDGQPMYRPVFEQLCQYQKKHPNLCQVIVVTQYPEILESARQAGLLAVVNHQPEAGVSETIRLGLDAASGSWSGSVPSRQGAVFFTADQPFLQSTTTERFLFQAALTRSGILAVQNQGQPGNPVAFDQCYFVELRALQGDHGGRFVLRQHLADVAWLEVSAQELVDLDTSPQ